MFHTDHLDFFGGVNWQLIYMIEFNLTRKSTGLKCPTYFRFSLSFTTNYMALVKLPSLFNLIMLKYS